jgi:hypothetical protein
MPALAFRSMPASAELKGSSDSAAFTYLNIRK